MTRRRLTYHVGVETNPGNPFGRSALVVEADGAVRLDHVQRDGSKHTWTARVDAGALDRLWAAIEQSGFPKVPQHQVPGGSTMRQLAVEGAPQSAMVEWHASLKMPGYSDAFKLLDQIIRQISGDTVRRVPASSDALVTDVKSA